MNVDVYTCFRVISFLTGLSLAYVKNSVFTTGYEHKYGVELFCLCQKEYATCGRGEPIQV